MVRDHNLRILSLSITLLGLAFIPWCACAYGIALAPSFLDIKDAVRDGEYNYSFTVVNLNDDPTIVDITTDGLPGEWITFYREDMDEKPIHNISLNARKSANFRAYIKLPKDTANGLYTGNVSVATAPTVVRGEENTSIVTAIFRQSSRITIEVTGREILDGKVEYIHIGDTEVNYPLYVDVLFANTGTVMAIPTIQVIISDNATTIDTVTTSNISVKPTSRETIRVPWNTTGRESKSYNASVSVLLDGKELAKKNVPFTILPTGTLTRQGNLTRLRYSGEQLPNTILKVMGDFENTGVIVTKAKLVGEVTKGGSLIATLSSEEIQVPPYAKDTLVAYVTLKEPGNYTIAAQVLFEGKKTNMTEILVTISESGTNGVTTPTSDLPFAVLSILGVLGVGLYVIRRQR